MTFQLKLIAAVVLFFLSILSGVVLTKSGRPLKTGIFTLHKLLAVASIIFAGMLIYSLYQTMHMNTAGIVFLSATVFFILGIFITGAFLSFEKPLPASVLWLHRIMTVATLVFAAFVKYFLSNHH